MVKSMIEFWATSKINSKDKSKVKGRRDCENSHHQMVKSYLIQLLKRNGQASTLRKKAERSGASYVMVLT